jgi:flavocytochrome c
MSLWTWIVALIAIAVTLYFTQRRIATVQKHVIVVGGGLAGLTTSLQLAAKGARVTLLDKETRLGGNSAKASSGINAALTLTQVAEGVDDSVDAFYEDMVRSGRGYADEKLVRKLAERSSDGVRFLESCGVRLDQLSRCGGHSHARTHRTKPPEGRAVNVGFEIVKALVARVERYGPRVIDVRLESRVVDLILDESVVSQGKTPPVVGVRFESRHVDDGDEAAAVDVVEVRGDAVVVTSGGYAADRDGLLARHAPSVASLATTNGPWATGDMLSVAERVGASLKLMDQVQVHPTGFVDPARPDAATKFLAPEALRASGGLLLNPKNGRRFVNELGLRDHVSTYIFDTCGPTNVSLLVLNDAAVQRFYEPATAFYRAKGFIRTYEGGADELAAEHGFGADALRLALAEYDASASGERADRYGKTVFPVRFDVDGNERLHVALVTPVVHYTMGGLGINQRGQVIAEWRMQRNIVPGLYAAGEVTGGLHGANRLAGSSLAECVVFGMIAAESIIEQQNNTK